MLNKQTSTGIGTRTDNLSEENSARQHTVPQPILETDRSGFVEDI